LLDEDVGEYNTNFKMNPPLRSAADREAILVALADGTVDAIATGPCASCHARKNRLSSSGRAFGITGLGNRTGAGDYEAAPRTQDSVTRYR